MKIDYLFSRNKKWGSRVISWGSSFENIGLKDMPSHVAVLINDSMVIESVLGKGVRIAPYKKWKEINEELYKIPCAQPYRSSREVIDELMSIWGKPYDWRGILYFSYCFIRLILLDKPMPAENKWERKTHFFCTEFAGKVSGSNYSMTTPAKMCDEWLKELDDGKN